MAGPRSPAYLADLMDLDSPPDAQEDVVDPLQDKAAGAVLQDVPGHTASEGVGRLAAGNQGARWVHRHHARPDSLEEAQIQAACAATKDEAQGEAQGAWTKHRATKDETIGDDGDERGHASQGPSPQEWLDRGWIDYGPHRRQPVPGEAPWWGWCNYERVEWHTWRTEEVKKAIRLAEREESDGDSPSTRAPKRARAPTQLEVDLSAEFDKFSVQ